jgi:hypothetical protein
LAIVIGQGATRALYGLFLAAALIGGGAFAAKDFLSALALIPAVVLALGLIIAMLKTPVSTGLNRLIAGTVGFQILLLLGMAFATFIGL